MIKPEEAKAAMVECWYEYAVFDREEGWHHNGEQALIGIDRMLGCGASIHIGNCCDLGKIEASDNGASQVAGTSGSIWVDEVEASYAREIFPNTGAWSNWESPTVINARLAKERDELKVCYNNQKDTINVLQADIYDLETARNDLTADKEALRARVNQLESDRKGCFTCAGEMRDKRIKLTNDCDALNLHNERLVEDNAELRKQGHAATAKVEDLQRKLDRRECPPSVESFNAIAEDRDNWRLANDHKSDTIKELQEQIRSTRRVGFGEVVTTDPNFATTIETIRTMIEGGARDTLWHPDYVRWLVASYDAERTEMLFWASQV